MLKNLCMIVAIAVCVYVITSSYDPASQSSAFIAKTNVFGALALILAVLLGFFNWPQPKWRPPKSE